MGLMIRPGRARISRHLAVSLLLSTLSACAGSRAEPDRGPTPLLDAVQSRLTPEAVRAILRVDVSWRKFDEWTTHKKGVEPGIRVVRFLVEPYDDLGNEGKLELWFVDNQLMSMAFTPRDWTEYIRVLVANRGLNPDRGDIKVGSTRVFAAGDALANDRYVRWEDAALASRYRRFSDS